jgi:hypothetical protein
MGEVVAMVSGKNGHVKLDAEPPMRLVKCPNPAVLKQHWPWIKDRLEIIKKKNKDLLKWTPKHVRQMILSGLGNLTTHELWFAVEEDGILRGFIISYVQNDPFVNLGDSLHVWLGFGNMKIIEKLLPEFEAIARDKDLEGIEFSSPRKAWALKIAKLGFHMKTITYRKDLT